MSIALNARIKELERRLAEVESRVASMSAAPKVVQSVDIYPSNWGETSAAEAMPQKRKPGRPPKHG